MKRYLVVSATGGALAVLLSSIARIARAEPEDEAPAVEPFLVPGGERPFLQRHIPATSEALELTIATGYTQPFGMLRSGSGFPDVARAGIGVGLGAGYRIDPHWGVAIDGQYQELSTQDEDAARGASGTFAAQYHIDPRARLDPWVELGVGYRALWQVEAAPAQTLLTHGIELARARVGVDLRISPDVSIAPVIGADATLFLWQDMGTITAISSPAVSTFVFAGLQGRVDVNGTQVGTASVTSSRPRNGE